MQVTESIFTYVADFRFTATSKTAQICELVDDQFVFLGGMAIEHKHGLVMTVGNGEMMGIPCNFLPSATPDINLVIQTDVCGPENALITFEQDGVIFSQSEWGDGTATITFKPATGFYIPDEAVTTHTVTDASTDCLIESELVPPMITAVCGPDNDQIDMSPT